MASAAERFHIVLSPDEKRHWTQKASAIGLSTGEYVRRAVAAFGDELTPEQLGELEAAADEAQAAAARISVIIDDMVAVCRMPLDEAAMRARATERLAAEPFDIDPAILDFAERSAA